MNLHIPQISGHQLPISLEASDRLFIVGANGSGKSALIQHLVSSNRGQANQAHFGTSTDMVSVGEHRPYAPES